MSDNAVLQTLFVLLNRLLPPDEVGDQEDLLGRLTRLPPGLRAMAAVHQLDVSMSLDDLGWHFANHHHLGFVDATADGLSELGAHEPEAIFREAFALVKPEWDYIGSLVSIDFDSFVTWYSDSALSRDLQPLNRRFWAHLDQFEDLGLYYYWVQYARHNPDLLKDDFSETG